MKILDIISALRKNGIVPRVDGQHLRLSGKVSQLPDDLLQLLREHKQQIIDFLQESRVEGAPESIQALPTAQHYPLSNAQKRIWVLSQFEGGNQAYNICMALHLEGVVEVDQLELAFRKSLERHESLRTTFSVIDEEPVQIVHAQLPFSIQRMDFSRRKNVKQALTEELENLSNFQFDLVNGPLLSIQLIDIAPREHVLIFSMHHIISDGWSIGTWMQEVMGSYKNICLGLEQEEPPLDIHYKDFSAWLKNRIDGDFGQRASRFWQQKNLQEVEPLSLPYDFQRPELNRYEGASQKYYFEAEFYANMQALAKKNRSTLFNLYRAVWSLCLHKWSGQNQLIIGTPVAGRSHSQLHNQIGLYVNTLPLLSTYQPAQIFSEYLQELAGDSLESFKYQEYPLDLLIEQLDLARDTSRSPLFDILLVVQNTALGEGAIEWQQQHGFRMQDVDHYLYEEKPTERNKVPSKFDISINFGVEPDQRHFIQFEYRTKLFRKSSIQAFHKTFRHVLDQLMKNDSLPLGQIQIMNSSERQRILEQFNQPIQSHAEKSVMDLLSDNLQQMGQAVAVFSDHQSLSYAQLQERSDAYAHQFAAAQTDRIGIFLHRSAEILAIILAAFKAGKA
ncbi:MAG: condensation domain-containing protein, partial [Bacteroidota bacterium]